MRDRDIGDWIGTTDIAAIALDTKNNGVYIAGENGLFGYYNISKGEIEDLSATDSGEFINAIIFSLAYDSKNDGVYIVSQDGVFAYYNKSANITTDLSDRFSGGIAQVFAVAYDSVNDGAYIGGTSTSKFVYYSRATDAAEGLSATSNIFNDITSINGFAYDSKNDGVYITGDPSFWAYYNRSANKTHDLRQTDENDFMQDLLTSIGAAYNNISDSAFVSGTGGMFGLYRRANNVTQDLSGTDVDDWIDNIADTVGPEHWINDVQFDHVHNGVFILGPGSQLTGCCGAYIFGYYDNTSNQTHDLRDTDTNNFMGNNAMDKGVYNPKDNNYYFVGKEGFFARYSHFLPASQVTQTTTNGSNVSLNFENSVSVTFSSVATAGETTVKTFTATPSPQTGFLLNGVYTDISTTANVSGPITIKLPYDPNNVTDPLSLRLYHFDKTNNTWIDVTVSVNTTSNTVTGIINSLSPFAVGVPLRKFVGFLSPLREKQKREFKLGRRIDVRFRLLDDNDKPITNASAQMFVAKVNDDGTLGTEQKGVSRVKPDKFGNSFRLNGKRYVFDLDTKPLSIGTWRIRALLDDGISYLTRIKLLEKSSNGEIESTADEVEVLEEE